MSLRVNGHRWLLGLLLASYTCAFVDRIIMAILGPAISRDLGLTDVQFGLLGGMAFAVFYSAFGVPIAWMAERTARTTVLVLSAAVWSLMTMLCGLATSFAALFACRVGVGIGEAGCTPPAHSLISDRVPPDRRASALSIYSLGVPLGALIGAAAGGVLAQAFGWRAAFVAVGAPGLAVALLIALTIDEPRRRETARGAPPAGAVPFTVALTWWIRQPTLRHLVAACAITTCATNGINLFAPTYLVRRFAGGLAETGLAYGLMVGVAGVAGVLAGGFVTDVAARHDRRWFAWMPAASLVLAFPFYVLAYVQSSMTAAIVTALVGVALASLHVAPAFALAQNLVAPGLRASISAILLLAMNVVGQGLGPLAMGAVSDAAAARAFAPGAYAATCLGAGAPVLGGACGQAAATGVQSAILAVTGLLLWGAAHFVAAARSMDRAVGPGSETAV